MRNAVWKYAATTLISVALVVLVGVLGYHFLHRPASAALGVLRAPDPVDVLLHDRGYMNMPPGATLWYDETLCDSGQLFATRHLHASPTPALVRARYEEELLRAGWTIDHEPHRFRRALTDDRDLYVGVDAPDEHGDLAVSAAADPPSGLQNC